MDALTPERRRELARRVFPDLRYGGDPDIERYFEHRRNGRMGEALAIYNGPLRARYPDDGKRVVLLRLFREGDPRWLDFQDSLVTELGGRVASGLARNIDILAAPLAGLSRGDAFKSLSVAEALLRIVPAGDDDALLFLERYRGFASFLGHREGEMEQALALAREYVAMTRADSPAEYDFIARSEAIEARRRETDAADRARRGAAAPREKAHDFIAASEAIEARKRREEEARSRYFDLSRVRFSAEDRSRVEIPESLARKEDRVLAFCWKYWELVSDPGFERLVFLWSRKYGTRHYAIFHAIKVGRARRLTDDEILTAVSTILSTSYSYSVSGDLYMQASWRRLKARAEAERAAAVEAAARAEIAAHGRRVVAAKSGPEDSAPAPGPTSMPHNAPSSATAHGSGGTGKAAASQAPARAPAAGVAASARAPAGGMPARAADPADPKSTRPRLAKAAPPEAPRDVRHREAGIRPLAGGQKRKPTRDLIASPKAPPPEPLAALAQRAGSVSDRIRKLSGKAYDVHRQLFLEQVRADIHRHLLGHRRRSFRLFDDSANEAEDIIYAYLAAHYADPYMNWEESPERSRVEALGYTMPSLDPVIEAWFRRQ